jgi:SAM-dependent methyltransferase
VITPEAPLRLGREVRRRYTSDDLGVLTPEETRRFVPESGADPQANPALAWELLYRLEPQLYDRLASAERLHPALLGRLPQKAGRIVEVGAGTGRLTLELIDRAEEIVAVEPAAPLRDILAGKLSRADHGERAVVTNGFFDDLPVVDDWADLVVACSALTPEAAHGGDVGLAEMERVCAAGGTVAIVWPNQPDWLGARGYEYVSFEGEMFVEFASPEEAVELAAIFYPGAVAAVRRLGARRVPYELLGINPPRDLALKVMPG